MKYLFVRRLAMMSVMVVIASCDSSESNIAVSSESEDSPANQPSPIAMMSVEGVDVMDDSFVWNTFYQSEDAEPTAVDGVTLNTLN